MHLNLSAIGRYLATTLCCLGLFACSSKPYTDYDTGFNFAAANTWYMATADASEQSLMAPRIAAAIDSDLGSKGLRQVSSASDADIIVSYSIAAEEKPNNSRFSIGLGTGSYGGRGGASIGGSVSQPIGSDMLLFNTIQIDMRAPQNQQLIWRGADSFEIKGDDAQAKADAAHKLVTRILAGFPPAAGAATTIPAVPTDTR
jgi:hypothetical protein